MRLRFTKMHGQGNDFVVIDGVRQAIALTAGQVRAIADRHFGIGCDQLLLVEPARDPGNDFRYRIWNADGGEVEQCGNGARCFARFVRDQGLTDKDQLRVETARGVILPRIEPSGRVRVDMGPPRFAPADVPFIPTGKGPVHEITAGDETILVSVLSMGNPHAVQVVADVDDAPVARQGPLIENHPAFPERVNAGYLQVVARNHARLRVWERGAGETLSCGTGACAAVVAGILRGLLDAEVRVTTRGGDLTIAWSGVQSDMTHPVAPVMMTGDAVRVFEGEIDLPAPGTLETPA
ncbi:MAG TPA: diaminopimelate epimerase [Usitatibacteraceae bacterium]|nr:diaminopimelate epimerase [Usitatibacteraceae bacterium]